MNTNNCNYKMMHAAQIGNVQLCQSCGNLKVEIGALLALISKKSFDDILSDFKTRRAYYLNNLEEDMVPEQVIICLNKENLFLNLSPADFDDLIDLFEMASHMLEVNQIFDFTE